MRRDEGEDEKWEFGRGCRSLRLDGKRKTACYPEKVRMDGEQDLPVRSADANMA